MVAITTMVAIVMPTTIQLDESTRRELLRYAAELQGSRGTKVTFDDAINELLKDSRRAKEARAKLESLFGSVRDGTAVRDLAELRRKERAALERRAGAT